MKFKSKFLALVCGLLAFCGMAQNTSSIDVNKDVDVAVVYEQVVKEGYGTPDVYLKLANAHYFKANYADAKKWFEKVFESGETSDKKTLFRYKQTLKALKLDLDSNKYLSVTDVGQNN